MQLRMCIHRVVVYLIKKVIEWKSLLSLVGKLGFLPCHHVHSLHKKRRKKENSIIKKLKKLKKKQKTVEIFFDNVRSSVPGAEGQ